MRHRVKGKKLNRNASHRRSMFRNMVNGLLANCVSEETGYRSGRILTTVAKAKALRSVVDKMITLAKKAAVVVSTAPIVPARGSVQWSDWRKSTEWGVWANAVSPAVAYRRRAFAFLRSDSAVRVLFEEVANRFKDRTGGYTRVIRLPSYRVGDASRLAIFELSDRAPRH